MTNKKNFIRQISESYIQMKLDEASPPGGNGVPKWYRNILPQPQGQPMKPRYVDWYNENQYWKAVEDWRQLERQAQPQSPNTPRPGNSPTSTTRAPRTPFRLPKIPPAALRLLGRTNAVAGAALLGWELGTAIDQYLNPPRTKPPLRPYQQDVLPAPTAPTPSSFRPFPGQVRPNGTMGGNDGSGGMGGIGGG